jgi:hypothetical protein
MSCKKLYNGEKTTSGNHRVHQITVVGTFTLSNAHYYQGILSKAVF